MNPRRAAIIGLLFIGIAVFYLGFTQLVDPATIIDDYAGFTMLLALGLAMAIMGFVLALGMRRS